MTARVAVACRLDEMPKGLPLKGLPLKGLPPIDGLPFGAMPLELADMIASWLSAHAATCRQCAVARLSAPSAKEHVLRADAARALLMLQEANPLVGRRRGRGRPSAIRIALHRAARAIKS